MDLMLNPDQQAIVDTVEKIFDKQAGNARARMIGSDGHDDELLRALSDGGFLDLWHDRSAGPLGAELIVERASLANARLNLGARMLVAPAVLGNDLPDKVALMRRGSPGAVRFGQHADFVLIVEEADAFVAPISASTPVGNPYGFPYAFLTTGSERSLGAGSAANIVNWWRVALAAEIAGALGGAIWHTVRYLTERRQFDKPLGALQALQHRLAEAYVWSEGTTWLARRAAFSGAATDAAAAAAHAAHAAQLVGADMHQLSGAIGFTTEFDLQLWTTRLQALRVELGGATAHELATAAAHWEEP